MICLVQSDGDCVWNGLFGGKACPHHFWGEQSKLKDIVYGLLDILCERWEDGTCFDPLLNGESRVAQRQRIEDAGGRLKKFLGCEVARSYRVSVQSRFDSGRGWGEELGKRCGSVKKPSALAPEYQGDNLYIMLIGLFYESEKIVYFLRL